MKNSLTIDPIYRAAVIQAVAELINEGRFEKARTVFLERAPDLCATDTQAADLARVIRGMVSGARRCG